MDDHFERHLCSPINSLPCLAPLWWCLGWLHQPGTSLSGGQQQRLCIARAIAVQPEVILMDEPTSALDPISTATIEDLMDRLKRRYTIITVTHNMQQAARIADYTAFFHLGEMIEYNDTKTMFSTPHTRKAEDYITGRYG